MDKILIIMHRIHHGIDFYELENPTEVLFDAATDLNKVHLSKNQDIESHRAIERILSHNKFLDRDVTKIGPFDAIMSSYDGVINCFVAYHLERL